MPLSNDTYETRLDYDVRVDDNPLYMGIASTGSNVNDPGWQIRKIDYDGSSRVTRVQQLVGSWTNRASLAWT